LVQQFLLEHRPVRLQHRGGLELGRRSDCHLRGPRPSGLVSRIQPAVRYIRSRRVPGKLTYRWLLAPSARSLTTGWDRPSLFVVCRAREATRVDRRQKAIVCPTRPLPVHRQDPGGGFRLPLKTAGLAVGDRQDPGGMAPIPRPWLKRWFADYATVPNSAPTPAVTAMAKAPQNVTRSAPAAMPAPPVCAANAPSSARNAREVPATRKMRPFSGANAVTRSGMAAPTAKLAADANAA